MVCPTKVNKEPTQAVRIDHRVGLGTGVFALG